MSEFFDWCEKNEERLTDLFIEDHGREPTDDELFELAESEYGWLIGQGWDGSDYNEDR